MSCRATLPRSPSGDGRPAEKGGGIDMYPQDYDNLIFEGRKACMLCAPPLPVEHPRVVRLSREEVARRHHSERLAGTSFYFYRSYLATWEIRNGRFYLQALYGDRRLIGEEPLSADWYTGPLRVPHGFELQRSRGIMK